MTGAKLLSRLLQMTGFVATWVDFRDADRLLRVGVKPRKTGCRCSRCNRRSKIVRRSACRVWEDVVVCGSRVLFHYAPAEIRCPTHGLVQERIPWASEHSRITYRLEYLVLAYCQSMTQKAAAQLLHIPKSTLSDHLHAAITRLREGHVIADIDTLGVDEISYRKGRKFATIVYDIGRQCVVWVGKGKGREAIDDFFSRGITEEQRKKIRFASCDMSQTYIGAITHWCPSAVLVLDRFHIVKNLNEALDDVRKEAWREAEGEERKMLKGLRWLLFRHSSTRKKSHTRKLHAVEKSNLRIYRAWVLKDEFEAFWEYSYEGSATSFLSDWIARVMKSRIEPLKKFARMIRKHWDHIIPFIKSRLTNALAEGMAMSGFAHGI